MQMYRQEFENLFSFPNLLCAYKKAKKWKKYRDEPMVYESDIFSKLSDIRLSILSESYRFWPYREFTLFDSKRRKIVAAPFRDRIVHWVLYDFLYPLFDPSFIHDSYGNRTGKWAIAGVKRTSEFMRSKEVLYLLKIDFSKYFFSIHHDILIEEITKKVQNPYLITLIRRLVSSYETDDEFDDLFHPDSPYRMTRAKGMPIGSLSSQLFANIYLNRLDHYCKDFLACKRYIRYVDDIVIFSGSKMELVDILHKIDNFCVHRLGLSLHPKKITLSPKIRGIDFLGYRIYPYHILPRKRTQKKIRSAIDRSDTRALCSYYGIVKHSDSHLRYVVSESIIYQ